MGFLEDLVKTVQEAVEEAREQQQGGPPRQQRQQGAPAMPPQPRPQPMTQSQQRSPTRAEAEAQATHDRLRRRFEEARRAQLEAEEAHDHRQSAKNDTFNQDVHAEHAAPIQQSARVVGGVAGLAQREAPGSQIARLMRDPRAVYEAIILREVLDLPVSLRHKMGPRR